MKQPLFTCTCCILLLFFTSTHCGLQAQELFSLTPGEISDYETTMTEYAPDPEAKALMIYDLGDYSYRGVPETGRFLRIENFKRKIKILKPEGLEEADIRISLYGEEKRKEEVTIHRAVVWNYENNQLRSTELDRSTIKEEKNENNPRYTYVEFTMPEAKVGSILELDYTVISPFHPYQHKWTFQDMIPVVYSSLSYKMIPFYNYTFYQIGDMKLDKSTVKEDETVELNGVKYKEVKCHFAKRDIPAFKDTQFITTSGDYKLSVVFQILRVNSAFRDQEGRPMPRTKENDFHVSWVEICDQLMEEKRFSGYIREAEKEAKKIVPGLQLKDLAPEEQMKKIVEYVKSSFVFNRWHSIEATGKLSDFLDKGEGNVADINLFLTGLLKAQKLEVYPVILSTRRHGAIAVEYPLRNALNYVIPLVRIDGKSYFLDATDRSLPFDELPERCSNVPGLVVKQYPQEWVNINQEKPAITRKSLLIRQLSEEKQLQVEVSSEGSRDEADSSYVRRDIAMEIDSGRILIPSFAGQVLSENPFKQESRQLPVDLIYIREDEYKSVIKIPEGFRVTSLPNEMQLDNPLLSFSYRAEKKEDRIEVEAVCRMKRIVYEASEYQALKESFDRIVAKSTEKIVLE